MVLENKLGITNSADLAKEEGYEGYSTFRTEDL